MSVDHQSIHKEVERTYAKAIKSAKSGQASSCCGATEEKVAKEAATGCCGGDAGTLCGPTGFVNGYTDEDRKFEDAAQSSFGCGNPLAFAGVEPGQTVLDLGSGAGFDLLIASDKVGPQGKVIGVDMTDAMIDVAREHIEQAGKDNIEVRKGLIESLPVEDNSVDWVISNCVINLSPDKPAVFAEIARVLKPGGRFSISDIVAEQMPDWLLAMEQAYSACVSGAISESTYLAGLKEAGLDADVSERLHYTSDQVIAMAGAAEGFDLPEEVVERAAKELDGSVWSAKFVGSKP